MSAARRASASACWTPLLLLIAAAIAGLLAGGAEHGEVVAEILASLFLAAVAL